MPSDRGFRAERETPGYVNVTARVTLDGNFFKRDPGKTFRANVRDMLDVLAAWMEAEVKGEIAGHAGSMPGYSGWSHDHTVGRTESYIGKRWGTWAVVSANTAGMSKADAIRTKAKVAGRHTSRGSGVSASGRRYGPDGTTPGIEGRWHPYRRVKSGVYRSRPVIQANLARGLE